MSEIGQKLIAEIRKAAADNPNKIVGVGKCIYFDVRGAPSCLVGYGLAALGVTSLGGLDNVEPFDNIYPSLFGGELDDEEASWVQAVQDHQDNQLGWSEAVALADRWIEVPL